MRVLLLTAAAVAVVGAASPFSLSKKPTLSKNAAAHQFLAKQAVTLTKDFKKFRTKHLQKTYAKHTKLSKLSKTIRKYKELGTKFKGRHFDTLAITVPGVDGVSFGADLSAECAEAYQAYVDAMMSDEVIEMSSAFDDEDIEPADAVTLADAVCALEPYDVAKGLEGPCVEDDFASINDEIDLLIFEDPDLSDLDSLKLEYWGDTIDTQMIDLVCSEYDGESCVFESLMAMRAAEISLMNMMFEDDPDWEEIPMMEIDDDLCTPCQQHVNEGLVAYALDPDNPDGLEWPVGMPNYADVAELSEQEQAEFDGIVGFLEVAPQITLMSLLIPSLMCAEAGGTYCVNLLDEDKLDMEDICTEPCVATVIGVTAEAIASSGMCEYMDSFMAWSVKFGEDKMTAMMEEIGGEGYEVEPCEGDDCQSPAGEGDDGDDDDDGEMGGVVEAGFGVCDDAAWALTQGVMEWMCTVDNEGKFCFEVVTGSEPEDMEDDDTLKCKIVESDMGLCSADAAECEDEDNADCKAMIDSQLALFRDTWGCCMDSFMTIVGDKMEAEEQTIGDFADAMMDMMEGGAPSMAMASPFVQGFIGHACTENFVDACGVTYGTCEVSDKQVGATLAIDCVKFSAYDDDKDDVDMAIMMDVSGALGVMASHVMVTEVAEVADGDGITVTIAISVRDAEHAMEVQEDLDAALEAEDISFGATSRALGADGKSCEVKVNGEGSTTEIEKNPDAPGGSSGANHLAPHAWLFALACIMAALF